MILLEIFGIGNVIRIVNQLKKKKPNCRRTIQKYSKCYLWLSHFTPNWSFNFLCGWHEYTDEFRELPTISINYKNNDNGKDRVLKTMVKVITLSHHAVTTEKLNVKKKKAKK